MACEHATFEARVEVHRLTRDEAGSVIAYAADVRVWCADCQQPFRWLGLEQGYSVTACRVSVDGQELRGALVPAGEPGVVDTRELPVWIRRGEA